MTNVMTTAWTIAKKGAANFGGSVKSYFAQSLKMAWTLTKKATNNIKSEIRPVGKKGDFAIIAVPTNLNATITNCLDIVQKAFSVQIKNGVEYALYTIVSDARFANFNTIVNGTHEAHVINIATGKVA